jgi:hypothetical protein
MSCDATLERYRALTYVTKPVDMFTMNMLSLPVSSLLPLVKECSFLTTAAGKTRAHSLNIAIAGW